MDVYSIDIHETHHLINFQSKLRETVTITLLFSSNRYLYKIRIIVLKNVSLVAGFGKVCGDLFKLRAFRKSVHSRLRAAFAVY